MTENLNNLISDIRSRSFYLAGLLHAERSQHEVLQGEINRVNELLKAEQALVAQLQQEVKQLSDALAEAQNKVVEIPVAPKGRNAEEINALVKEIEFCIEKLKQA
jgi:flagellar biosynthesis/type III secretory pathway chaperone